jgi:hypothetical protein
MICTSLLLSACNGVQTSSLTPATEVITPATVQLTPLNSPAACEQRFVRHELPHQTESGDIGSYVYVSNGSGLAIGDLNGDQRDDIALGNLAGSVTLLLNRGALSYTMYAHSALLIPMGTAQTNSSPRNALSAQ